MKKNRHRFFIALMLVFAAVTAVFFAYLIRQRALNRNTAPIVICSSDEIWVSVNATDEDLLMGVIAIDAEDGDVTDSLTIESISQFTEKGKCTITYAAFDSKNRVATASRTLHYTDYRSPHFEALSDFIYVSYDANPLQDIRAYDCFDGDISNRIALSVISEREMRSEVEFSVMNSYGDTASFRTTVVVNARAATNIPALKLSEYLVYINAGDNIDPIEYVKTITLLRHTYTLSEYGAENVYADMSSFDNTTPGQYQIIISCEHEGEVGSAILFVIVE